MSHLSKTTSLESLARRRASQSENGRSNSSNSTPQQQRRNGNRTSLLSFTSSSWQRPYSEIRYPPINPIDVNETSRVEYGHSRPRAEDFSTTTANATATSSTLTATETMTQSNTMDEDMLSRAHRQRLHSILTAAIRVVEEDEEEEQEMDDARGFGA